MKRDAYGSPWPRLSAFLDRVYAWVYRTPACGPEGCACRRTCSWLMGVPPVDWKRGARRG